MTKQTKQPQKNKIWRVQIIDLSGGAENHEGGSENDIVETIGPFYSIEHANAFARSYVRDSIERCRLATKAGGDVLKTWLTFGEDAKIPDSGDKGWHANEELQDFAQNPATSMERDWRSIDPRRLIDEGEIDQLEHINEQIKKQHS